MRLLVALLFGSLILAGQDSPDARYWLNRGVSEYKSARYPEAAAAFQKAVDLDPNNVNAHLYLATTWMSQYIPGAESPENLDLAHKAESEFQKALSLDPANTTALVSLASLTYQQAQGVQDRDQKLRKLDEAAAWYERLLGVDAQIKTAYYSIGVIDWVKWYMAWTSARNDLHMRPEQPGPFPDAAVRRSLLARYGTLIEHGISNLNKALEIDPQYDDAMAYMNLFIRERADLRDSAAEFRQDIATADDWVQKALTTKKVKAQAAQESALSAAPPPPPPPPPPITIRRVGEPSAFPAQAPSPSATAPQRLRVDGVTQAQKLIRRVDPIYPQMALQARIQGIVRFNAIIAKDGTIANLQLVSGHPLLIESARFAVMQWAYRPSLLNGELVEVVTTIDVNFSLPQ